MDEPYDTSTHADLGLMQGFPPPPDKRVDRLNGIWVPPYNRWAYQNMRKLWATQGLRPAPAPIDLPRRIDAAIPGLPIRRRDGSLADFDTFLRQSFTDSLVVLHKGAVVCERHLNGMTPNRPHVVFSCTKSLIGLLALQAIDDGLLSEDTPITDILPELAQSGWSGATFGHVLDMTSSLKFSEAYDDPTAEIHDYIAVLGAGVKADGPLVAKGLCDFACQIGPGSAPHGAVFDYQTPEADVLNWAVSRLRGQDFATLVEDRIWHPIGAGAEAYVMLDAMGVLFAGGGLNAAPTDLACFAAMMLAGGRVGGAQVIPETLIATLERGGSREAFARGPSAVETLAGGDWSFRAQWWVRHTPGHQAIMGLGVNGQWIYVDRTRQVAVVILASQPEADDFYFFDYTLNAIDAIIDHLSGQ